ncbi:MAG TPA: cytochrome P450 [Candidatus Sulfotelmatobacter sp.]
MARGSKQASSSQAGYRFPPGLKLNLLWYVLRKFRPGDPIGLFQHLARDYGDIAHYKIGPHHIIFLNKPEYIREVLIVQNDNFVKERTVQRSKMLLGEGMITSEGNRHRIQRQAAQPAFHRQRIPAYAAQIVDEAVLLRDSWSDGRQLDISREMMRLTLRIVATTLFGTELGDEVLELTEAINEIMRLYNYLIVLPAVDLLIHLRTPGIYGFTKAKKKLDAVVYRMVDAHRPRMENKGDLLDMMLRAENAENKGATNRRQQDEWLRDQVITIFLAGYETVANALTWAWYLLSENPDAARRMRSEIDTVLGGRAPGYDDLSQLKYCEAVLAESMRLYPPAWAMGRQALTDFALGEYFLPAGTTVLMSQFVTHRDPRYFDDPLRFNPERFLSGRSPFPKFAYFPFGAGPRQCIGEAFAWMEGVLVLATIAQKWCLRLVPGHVVEVQPLITLRAKYGMQMRAEWRGIRNDTRLNQ